MVTRDDLENYGYRMDRELEIGLEKWVHRENKKALLYEASSGTIVYEGEGDGR